MIRTDVVISPEGTLFLFYLRSPAAEQWVESNVAGDRRFFAGALVVEHRYADDLGHGMSNDGLRLGVITHGAA